MRVVDVFVVGIDDGADVARELFATLRHCQWCNAVLRFVSADDLSGSSFPADSISVFIHPDSTALSRVLKALKPRSPGDIFVFVNLFREPACCLELLMAGFDNFLTYPFRVEDIAARLQSSFSRKSLATPSEVEHVARKLALEIGLKDLIGRSDSFSRVLEEIKVLSRVEATLLITGETGTGKDMCARAIHYTSPRSSKPFIPVNCGAIPDELFANELFGHERGAFTDARSRHAGMIQQAEGGTLFLDDVDALSLSNQVKLLRFLQGNEYTPLGFGKPRTANARIIAATNVDLAEKVKQKAFREDVYFRLEVLTLSLPPLRDRAEDIPFLASHVISHYCSCYGKPVLPLTPPALRKLYAYHWPGNIRQLENVLHRAILHCSSDVLSDFDLQLREEPWNDPPHAVAEPLPFNLAKKRILSSFEREYVLNLLRLCRGNVTQAAARAGKHRRAFWEIMRRHNLSRSNF